MGALPDCDASGWTLPPRISRNNKPAFLTFLSKTGLMDPRSTGGVFERARVKGDWLAQNHRSSPKSIVFVGGAFGISSSDVVPGSPEALVFPRSIGVVSPPYGFASWENRAPALTPARNRVGQFGGRTV